MFRARLQLLARLTLNTGKHPGNQPARLAPLDDGNDRAILVQGDEGPAQVVRPGHRSTPSVRFAATKLPSLRHPPHRIFRFRARMAIVPSLRALSNSGKLFGFRRRTCRPQRPKFRIHFPSAASRANYDRVTAALNGETWGSVPIVVT